MRQTGQALVEWMVVAALAMLVVIWAAGEFAQKAEQAAADGYGQWLQAVSTAITEAIKHDDAGSQPSAGMFGQLPLNTLVPVEPWLMRLKQGGWLVAALASKPSLPYDIRLVRLDSTGACASEACPLTVLLLAMPRTEQAAVHPSTMLAALAGKGLAVTDLAPDRLRGAAYEVSNPMPGGIPLPLGTVGLLAWHPDHAPAYVRLHETRSVTLAGGVQLGQTAEAEGDCQPAGLVMVDSAGELLICQAGRWQKVGQPHDHVRQCGAMAQQDQVLLDLQRQSRLWPLLGGDSGCRCPPDFAAVNLGREFERVGPVVLVDGYACLRL